MRYRFGAFELDLARCEVRAGEQRLHVEPQVFALLACLVENRNRVLAKQELIDQVWGGQPVADATIASRVRTLRQLLGDDGRTQAWIRTVHGRGFRFVGEVSEATEFGAVAEATTVAPQEGGRPSIAVLPFLAVGTATDWPALHLALAHDLIAELSRLRWLLVTARASSFQFAGSDAAQAARRLGVRYLLTGQVEWHRQRIAVVVELTDTHAGQVVWGERFAGLVGDVHAIRSEISARVPAALDLQIPLREANRARLGEPAKLDAWLAFHLGLQHMYRFNAPDAQAAATHFRRALQLDPGLVRAHAGLSFVHFQAAFMNQTDDRPRESALARQHAERAVELDPLDPFANFTMGRSFWLDGDLEGSGEWLARATHISPSFAQGLYALGWKEVLCGQPLAARRNNDLAMRLSPFDPMYYAMLGVQAFSCLAQGDDEQAAVWSERAARAPGAHAYVAMIAAVMNHLAGNRESALRWRHAVAGSSQQLDASKFLEAFPMRHAGMRSRVTAALETLGF